MKAAFYVFVAMLAVDYVWALYVRHLSKANHNLAAFYSALTVLLGASVIMEYTASPWLVWPAAAGAAAGTYIASSGLLRTLGRWLLRRST